MYRFEQYELTSGEGYRGHPYFLTGFVEPAPRPGDPYDPAVDADGWGVALGRRRVFTDSGGEVVHTATEELVRMDTCHGRPHVDYVFLPPGHPDRRVWLDGEWPYRTMKRFLEANWRVYADAAAERR